MPIKNVRQAMHEYRRGELHSGKNGPVVKNRTQAIAIGLASERRAKRKSQGRTMTKGRR